MTELAVLGGGQLGWMLGLAAARLGIDTRFLDPSPDAPAGRVGPLTVAALDDHEAVLRFAAGADVVTYEWEGVPASTIEALLAAGHRVDPGVTPLAVSQDRLVEKTRLEAVGIPCAAHRAVESMTMHREVMLQRDQLSPKIAQLIYNGFWYSPEMEALTAFVDKSQENVTGTARIRLYKGSATIAGRRAEKTLYDPQISTFEEDEGAYDQTDATGFIRLNALRLRVRNKAGFFTQP